MDVLERFVRPGAKTAYKRRLSPFAFGADFRLSPRLCGEQIAGPGADAGGHRLPSHHTGDFRLAGLLVEAFDAGHRPPVGRPLGHPVVLVAERGDLRQVGDAEHLAAGREGVQPGADDVRHRPADAGVDLVEDQRLARDVGRGQRLHRQHHPRQLAARGDAAERPEVLADVRREEQLEAIGAGRSPLALRLDGVQRERAAGAGHGELGERLLERLGEARRGRPPGGGDGVGGACDRRVAPPRLPARARRAPRRRRRAGRARRRWRATWRSPRRASDRSGA